MPYNFVAESFHTKKLCGRLFKRSAILEENRPFCVFDPPLRGLGATYNDHLRLIGERVGDFLLVLIEFFFGRCYGWRATREYRFRIGDFATTGAGLPKISGKRGRLSPTVLKLNDLSYGIIIWTDFSSVFVTIHAFDRRTERQTDRQNSHR